MRIRDDDGLVVDTGRLRVRIFDRSGGLDVSCREHAECDSQRRHEVSELFWIGGRLKQKEKNDEPLFALDSEANVDPGSEGLQ
jgi:hypothetical protein